MGTSIVITSWNGKERLKISLPSIMHAWESHPEVIREIIVVDDASSDDTEEFLRLQFPQIRMIKNKQNRGFIYSSNKGVHEAREDIAVLLNNDVTVSNNFLDAVIPHFDDSSVFAVTFRSLGDDEKTFREGGKSMVFSLGFPHIRHALRHQAENNKYSLYAVGGHCAVRKQMFLALGGFDELFHPGYWEDVDISWRAWKNGWKVLYEPESVVYHKEISTMKTSFKRFTLKTIKARNRLLFIWKNISSPFLMSEHIFFLVIRTVTSIITLDIYFYPALFSALRLLPLVFKRRKTEEFNGNMSDRTTIRIGKD